jgi:hypothetical protein
MAVGNLLPLGAGRAFASMSPDNDLIGRAGRDRGHVWKVDFMAVLAQQPAQFLPLSSTARRTSYGSGPRKVARAALIGVTSGKWTLWPSWRNSQRSLSL